MKILLFGKPGAGKTTLANALSPLIGAPIFDGDKVRESYPWALGYSQPERERHCAHISAMCDAVTASGNHVIAATVAGTQGMRDAFRADLNVLVTGPVSLERVFVENATFDPPADDSIDLMTHHGHPPLYWASLIADLVQPTFNPLHRTALFVGRYQPFHNGHLGLIAEGLNRYGQVCIGVRDQNREWPFERVKRAIDAAMGKYRGRYIVIPLPNIAAVCYGRDVGYEVVRIDMPAHIEAISGTEIRRITEHARSSV